MKVILNSDVTNLGEEGDICAVAPGYARNYLLPKGLVMEYNERNLARIEGRRAEIEERRAQKRKEAAGIKEQLESEALVISMTAGLNGKLFGSVTASTIAEQLASRGIEVERRRIDVPEHSLKSVGTHKVKVKLYADEEAVVTVKVEAGNAQELQEKRARLGSRDPQEAGPAEPETRDEADGAVEQVSQQDEADGTVEQEAPADPEVIAMEQAAAEEEADDSEAVVAGDDADEESRQIEE